MELNSNGNSIAKIKRKLPNELLAELCAFIPAKNPIEGKPNKKSGNMENQRKKLNLLLSSSQLCSFLFKRFRAELSIFGPLLKLIKKTVDSGRIWLMLTILAAPTETGIKTWIDTNPDYKIRELGGQFLNCWRKDYYYNEDRKCLLWSDRIGLFVVPNIESNALHPWFQCPQKNIHIYGDWLDHPNLLKLLELILPPMGILSQYNLSFSELPKPKFNRKEDGKKWEMDFGKLEDWLNLIQKFSQKKKSINLLRIDALLSKYEKEDYYLDTLKIVLGHPMLNGDNDDENCGSINYLRGRSSYDWDKEMQSILIQWLMGAFHQGNIQKTKPKKLRLNLDDRFADSFVKTLIQEFNNATVEGAKFAICLELNEIEMENKETTFNNEKTNEVLRLLTIDNGYDAYNPDYPVILIVRMPAREMWPSLEIAEKPPTENEEIEKWWWKFDIVGDYQKCNLLMVNPEEE